MRVLVIDDDRELCELIRDYLEPLGYETTAEHDGPAGAERALAGGFQAVILDVMLPGADGFEVLRRIRRGSDVPVLMLTARGEETDRIVGLEMGADDYLPKTFSSRELLARLRAVVRRDRRASGHGHGHGRPAQRDRARRHRTGTRRRAIADQPVRRGRRRSGDMPLKLTALEFNLLESLARARGPGPYAGTSHRNARRTDVRRPGPFD